MQKVKTKTTYKQIDHYLKEAAKEIKKMNQQRVKDRADFKAYSKRVKEERKERLKENQAMKEQSRLTDIQLKSVSNQIKSMGIQLKSVGIHYGNISKNLGEVAEEFFFNGLEKNLGFNGLKFRTITRNTRTSEHEYDIILYNDGEVAILEVKHKLKLKTLKELKAKIKSFKKFFPNYNKYYGAVAGFVIPPQLREKSEKEGFFLLTQSGEDIKLLNKKGFKAKVF